MWKREIEERIYWKKIRGINVLVSDFRNSTESEVINLMNSQLNQINAVPDQMVYGVSLVKNTSSFSFILEETKRNPLIVKKENFITTLVGLTAFQKIKLSFLNKLYTRKHKCFNTTEQAFEYFLKINRQFKQFG